MYQYILVHTSMYSFPSFIQFSTYILKCYMYWYISVHTGMYQYVRVRTCIMMYWYIPGCTSTTCFLHRNPSSWWSTCWNIPLHTGTCQHVLYIVQTGSLSYCLILFWIQGGTRRYKAVQGTKALYLRASLYRSI